MTAFSVSILRPRHPLARPDCLPFALVYLSLYAWFRLASAFCLASRLASRLASPPSSDSPPSPDSPPSSDSPLSPECSASVPGGICPAPSQCSSALLPQLLFLLCLLWHLAVLALEGLDAGGGAWRRWAGFTEVGAGAKTEGELRGQLT